MINLINSSEKRKIEDRWINLVNPSEDELSYIAKEMKIPVDILKYPLDPEETSHLDIDENFVMIILDIPIGKINENTLVYDTYPLGIVYTSDTVITICLKETKIISKLIDNKSMLDGSTLVLAIINNIYKYYNIYLKELNNKYIFLERYLHRKMKNKQILQLFALKKSLVYFEISLKSNEMTLKKLFNIDIFRTGYNEKMRDEILIEHRQTSEMVKIYSSVINNTISFFSYIISNNSNITMKKLAEITVILSIPTIIASIFGMNILLPITREDPNGLAKIAVITIICLIIASTILLKKNRNN